MDAAKQVHQNKELDATDILTTSQEKLQRAQKAARSADFQQADELLSTVAPELKNHKQLRRAYKRAERQIARLKQLEITTLSEQLSKWLQNNDTEQELFYEKLDQLAFLDPDRAGRFQQQLVEQQRQQRETQQYEELSAQLHALWHEADDLIARELDYETVIAQTYKRAVDIAAEAASITLGLDGLYQKAVRKLENARKRFEILSTSAEIGEFKQIYNLLEGAADDQPIQLFGPGNKLIGTMPVHKARGEVIKMAEEFAYRKAIGYREAAELHMAAHAPLAADAILGRADDLFQLDELTQERLRLYRLEEVQPALVSYKQAEKLLDRARHTINPTEGWQLVEQAVAAYPWLADADEVRFKLVPQLVKQLTRMVAKGEKQLAGIDNQRKSSGNWQQLNADLAAQQPLSTELMQYLQSALRFSAELIEKAGVSAATAKEARENSVRPDSDPLVEARTTLATLDAARAQRAMERQEIGTKQIAELSALETRLTEIIAQTASLATLQSTLENAAVQLQQLMKQDILAAGQYWETLQQQHETALLQAYAPLNQLARALNAKLNIKQLLAQLEQDAISNDAQRIKQAITICEEAAKDRNNIPFKDQLTDIRTRLQLRLDFLIGRSYHEVGDAKQALILLKNVTSGPDQSQAQELIKTIQQQLAQEESILETLNRARGLIKLKPQKAYDILHAFADTLTNYHDEILEELENAQTGWQNQNTARLEAYLNKPLSSRATKEMRRLEMERRTELGINDRLNQQVLGACHNYDAEVAARNYQWQQAATKWGLAFEADQNEHYQVKARGASKKHAEQLLLNKGETAEPIIRQLLVDMPHDPELDYWIAKLSVQHAQAFETSPTKAEQLYYQASEQLVRARAKLGAIQSSNISDLNGDSQPPQMSIKGLDAAILESDFQKLQKKIQIGLAIEEKRQQIEFRLHPNKPVTEFYETRNEAERLLKEYAQFPDGKQPLLPRWWQRFRMRIIHELEQQVEKTKADEDWKRFEPLSKILALDEDHHQAIGVLSQINSLSLQLQEALKGFDEDKDGLSISGDDNSVLEKQIQLVQGLQLRGRAIYAMLQRLASRVADGQTAITTVGTTLTAIRETLSVLQQFNRLTTNARQGLINARSSGDWSNFGRILEKIAKLGFGSHRTTTDLNNRRNQDETRRAELKKQMQQIEEFAKQGNFIAALRLAARLQNRQTGDPLDEFGLQRTYVYQDPETHAETTRLDIAISVWEDKVLQLRTISRWLVESGLGKLALQHELLEAQPSKLPQIASWQLARQEIETLQKSGNFNRAKQIIQAIISGPLTESYLHLELASQRLSIPPVRPADLDSLLARDLLAKANEARDKLQQQIAEAKKAIQTLQRIERDWEDRWEAFVTANKKLQRARLRRWPFGKQAVIQETETQRRTALISCLELCPLYPDLQGVR